MNSWIAMLCALLACASLQANAGVWQPATGHTQIPLWPGPAPDMQAMPGAETATLRTEHLIAGKPWLAVTNVTQPTMTVYAPKVGNTGAAVVVFPGGGFEVLAMDLEGTEACDWLTAHGITCVLLKYRVPSLPYDWHTHDRPDDFVVPTMALEDAQRAMGLVRLHAKQWRIDPHKLGVMGFSAGGYLVAEISTHYAQRLYPVVDAADRESARPDFALAIYPGHLAHDDDSLNKNVPVTRDTPPTFLLQAEDDYVDGVNQSLVYYTALAKAQVPAELHIYAHGDHAFGLRANQFPITAWPNLALTWLRTLGVLPK
ncbi:MAG: alpha/beta hydrolase [Proteobacteria bacterium]|nr:alpha/beta hydrolase [Pseudomonadota bacterium]